MRWYSDRPPDHVHCYTCGLLVQYDPHSEMHEVPLAPRFDPLVFWDDGIPHCGVGRLATSSEFEIEFRKSNEPKSAAIEVIQRERRCPEWLPYIVGLSLQDHLRERQMHRLEEQRREWEAVQGKFAQQAQDRIDTIFFRLGMLQVVIGVIGIVVAILVAWLFGPNVRVIIQ